MNKTQKKIIYVAMAVIVLMGLFPPWYASIKTSYQTRVVNLGYYLIVDTPHESVNGTFYGGQINFATLFLQWVIVAGLAGGLWYMKKDSE